MYFDSDRDGAATIYTSTGGGPWSIPAAVSELDGYFRPDVTPDGRTMVLTRIAADGKTDVYQSTR